MMRHRNKGKKSSEDWKAADKAEGGVRGIERTTTVEQAKEETAEESAVAEGRKE